MKVWGEPPTPILMAPKFEELIQKAREASMGMVTNPLPKKPGQGGTVFGGFHQDTSGDKWYVKYHHTEDWAHSEHLGNKIYRALGHNAPHSQILYTESHRPVYFSKEVRGFKTLSETSHEHDIANPGNKQNSWRGTSKEAAHKFLHGLAADALLGNNDLHDQNVGTVHGRVPTRIDNGASLLHGGNGARRDSKTGGYQMGVGEIGPGHIATNSFSVHTDAAYHAGHYVDDVVHPKFLKPHVNQILKLRDQHGGWENFVNRHVPGAPDSFKQKATNILNYRTNKLVNYVKGGKFE